MLLLIGHAGKRLYKHNRGVGVVVVVCEGSGGGSGHVDCHASKKEAIERAGSIN